MSPNILSYLKHGVRPHMQRISKIAEIGALNVNGSAKQILHRYVEEGSTWVGIDRVKGKGVDIVANAVEWLADKQEQFDMVVACECYEHDPKWWLTSEVAKKAVKKGGLYVVTAPGIAFPFHDFGGDYYRFTEMAFREVVFENLTVIDVTSVHGMVGKLAERPEGVPTVVGFARKS